MPPPPRAEWSASTTIAIAGLASESEIARVERLLLLHPSCRALPIEGELLKGLLELGKHLDSLPIRRKHPSDQPRLQEIWERVLRIELGTAWLRAASKVFGGMPGGVFLLRMTHLEELEEYFRLFPMTPLVFVLGRGVKPNPLVAARIAQLRGRGIQIMPLKMEALLENSVPLMAELLEFGRLKARDFDWDRFTGVLSGEEAPVTRPAEKPRSPSGT